VVLLIITICLSPLLALASAVAFLFGWIALGWLVGKRLLAAIKAKSVAPVWEASLGVFLITLLGAIPCVGWLVWVVGGAFGLGAVVVTRLGTRPYNGAAAAPQTVFPPDYVPPSATEGAGLPQSDVELSAGDEVADEAAVAGPLPGPEGLDLAVDEVVGMAGGPEPGDDLELINGIGPVFSARLREKGITTLAQLAAADPEALAAIVESFPERVVEDDWVGQAKRMLE